MVNIDDLKKYSEIDFEKRQILYSLELDYDLLYEREKSVFASKGEIHPVESADSQSTLNELYYSEGKDSDVVFKLCPKCGKAFPDEIFCPDCLVRLKSPDDVNIVGKINIKPVFPYADSNNFKDFSEILTQDNYDNLEKFNFTIDIFEDIILNIKKVAFRNFKEIIVDNSIDVDELGIVDKVLLFTKSFVPVNFKSYGVSLGFFEYNSITIDDRQVKSLQITTCLHELTHFLINEILTQALCRLLGCCKNNYVESLVIFLLNYVNRNKLVDEYAAHTVEGRFTIYGYQDYSSFLAIEHDLDDEEVDIAKTIGNTFANYVKDILESFLDDDLRDEIKHQFRKDNYEAPNYNNLLFESCNKLNDEGLCLAVKLILSEVFSCYDLEILEEILDKF